MSRSVHHVTTTAIDPGANTEHSPGLVERTASVDAPATDHRDWGDRAGTPGEEDRA